MINEVVDLGVTAIDSVVRRPSGSLLKREQLLSRLACPECRANVGVHGGAGLRCRACGAVYHVTEGVPIMLPQASRATVEQFAELDVSREPESTKARLIRLSRTSLRGLVPPSPGLENRARRAALKRVLESCGPDRLILDLGAGGRAYQDNVIKFDIVRHPGVELVGDARAIPLAEGSVDAIVCISLLQHVAGPAAIAAEMHRVLSPNGLVFCSAPFVCGYHCDPSDYNRFPLPGMRHLMRDFEEVESGVESGPTAALIWVLREYASLLFRNQYLGAAAAVAMGWATAPLRYLDLFLHRRERAHRIANSVYFVGRKQ